MTQSAPWIVRHLYSSADPAFDRYLRRMRALLYQACEAGWIHQLHEVPLSEDAQILPALAQIRPGELVIIDLHGWADVDDPARLGTRPIGPYAQLANLPAGSCHAAALILGNCRGGRFQFLDVVARWVSRLTAVAFCFDGAAYSDHGPVAIARGILDEIADADEKGAMGAMDAAICNDLLNNWGCDLVGPAR